MPRDSNPSIATARTRSFALFGCGPTRSPIVRSYRSATERVGRLSDVSAFLRSRIPRSSALTLPAARSPSSPSDLPRTPVRSSRSRVVGPFLLPPPSVHVRFAAVTASVTLDALCGVLSPSHPRSPLVSAGYRSLSRSPARRDGAGNRDSSRVRFAFGFVLNAGRPSIGGGFRLAPSGSLSCPPRRRLERVSATRALSQRACRFGLATGFAAGR